MAFTPQELKQARDSVLIVAHGILTVIPNTMKQTSFKNSLSPERLKSYEQMNIGQRSTMRDIWHEQGCKDANAAYDKQQEEERKENFYQDKFGDWMDW